MERPAGYSYSGGGKGDGSGIDGDDVLLWILKSRSGPRLGVLMCVGICGNGRQRQAAEDYRSGTCIGRVFLRRDRMYVITNAEGSG